MTAKKPVRLGMIFLASAVLAGCSSVTFVQYEQPGEHETISRWHHATLNGMVELSRPLDLSSVCDDKAWTNVTTEFTTYNFLVTAIIPGVPYLNFYSGWTNKVQCFEPPTSSDKQSDPAH